MRIRLFAGAAEAAGREELTLVGPLTLASLRGALAAEHGAEFADVLSRCSLMIDGTRGGADDLVVADSATVDVLPPFAGG